MVLRRGNPGAFTLIEVTVVIGIVMILVGLLLPSLAKSRENARLTRDLQVIRGMAASVLNYAQQNKDYFPGTSTSVVSRFRNEWHDSLVVSGHSENANNLMPSVDQTHRVYMMGAAFLPPTSFDPSSPVAWTAQPAISQRLGSVVDPSRKGMLFRATLTDGPAEDRTIWWCCTPLNTRPGPVIFCDGSGVLSGWTSMYMSTPMLATTFQGAPVLSTWHGVSGRDR